MSRSADFPRRTEALRGLDRGFALAKSGAPSGSAGLRGTRAGIRAARSVSMKSGLFFRVKRCEKNTRKNFTAFRRAEYK